MKRVIAVAAAATVLVAGAGVGAVAAGDGKIGSFKIRDNSVRSVDVRDGSVGARDLRPGTVDRFTADTGLTAPQADGPYPGATQLVHGSNSTAKWTDAGLNTSWVKCAEGEVAIGGGFSRGDEGGYNDLNIVSASPALIVDGEVISISGVGLSDHVINEDWSFVPNGWVVEGFVNGSGERIVRPHVVCATP